MNPQSHIQLDRHTEYSFIGGDELIANLHQQLKGYIRFLHCDHRLVNIGLFAGGQIGDTGICFFLKLADPFKGAFEHLAERDRAGLPGWLGRLKRPLRR